MATNTVKVPLSLANPDGSTSVRWTDAEPVGDHLAVHVDDIAPALDGSWVVTHRRSGRCVAATTSRTLATAKARALCRLAIDWSLYSPFTDDAVAVTDETREQVRAIVGATSINKLRAALRETT